MKDEIINAAFTLFFKNGIRKMTIQKLIAPLAISTKTFYKYFKNKEELIEEVLSLHYIMKYQLLENHSADQNVIPLFIDIWYKAMEREYSINNTFFYDLHYYYPELEMKIENKSGHKIWRRFRQIVRKGIRQGVFRKDIHPDVVMESIAVLYNSVARTGQFKRFRVSPFGIWLDTISIYIRGFCTLKGIHELEEQITALKPFGVVKELR